ncbi:MAG: 30S ribosomal protein S6 [Opitutales bacterium]
MILDTRGYEDPVESLVTKLEDILKELGAEISKTENVGHKEFVSGAVKKHAGDTYLLIDFSGPASLPGDLASKTRLDKTIKRLQVSRR